MKQVLLTGATGFIGRQALLPLIARGFDVHCTYRKKMSDIISDEKNVTWHKIDLLNNNDVEKVFKSVSPDYLLHLAWDVTPGSYLESTNNFNWLVSSLHLLHKFAESGGRRAVCAGTCFEYDLRYGYCTENLTPTLPSTYYGSCKHEFQLIGEKYADKAGFDFAWGRIFYPYGPYEDPKRLVPSVIKSLLHGETAQCTHGNQIRDFLHVADVADAFVTLLDSEIKGNVNIGSGKPVSIKELVMEIGKNLGKEEISDWARSLRVKMNPRLLLLIRIALKKKSGGVRNILSKKGLLIRSSWWKKMGELK